MLDGERPLPPGMDPARPPTLREQVLTGSVYLVARKLISIVVSFAGIIALTRLIGADDFGVYTAAIGIYLYVAIFGRLGIDVFLIRRQEAPTPLVFRQTFTISLLSGATLAALVALAVPVLSDWFDDDRFALPLGVLVMGLPITLLSVTPIASLERALDYRSVALLELVSMLVFYVVAISAAVVNPSVWAPVGGWLVSQVVLLVSACWVARVWPKVGLSRAYLHEIFGHGIGYSASSLVWGLRSLVNPLVVGKYAGPEGVAFVALAIKFVETLTFVKEATYRLSIATLSRVNRDLPRMRRVVEEAMTLQILSVAPLPAVFVLLAPTVVPRVFGPEWEETVDVLPLVAVGYIINSIFNMQSSALYALGKNMQVTLFHAVHVAVFVGSALVFVPRYGVVGYGLGEVAALVAYGTLHLQLTSMFTVSYRKVLPWVIAFVPPLFAPYVESYWTLLLYVPLVVVVARRSEREVLAHYGHTFAGMLLVRRASRSAL